MKRLHFRFTFLLLLASLLVLVAWGTLFAADEQLPRTAFLSGGGTISSDGATLRSNIGLWATGSSISSSSGVGFCSGFGCDIRTNDPSNDDPDDPSDPNDPDDPEQDKLFLPIIQD